MTPEQLDQLALEVAEHLIEERGGSRIDDKWDLFQYTLDLTRRYRKALKEKMEPIYQVCDTDSYPSFWDDCGSGDYANAAEEDRRH